MYPEYPKLQLTQERCGLLDSYRVGDMVKVSFNLRGRPYEKGGEKTYFTNLEAWRVEAAGQASAPAPAAKPAAPASKPAARPDVSGMSFTEGGEDDLPF
jgi:hypothetical protein